MALQELQSLEPALQAYKKALEIDGLYSPALSNLAALTGENHPSTHLPTHPLIHPPTHLPTHTHPPTHPPNPVSQGRFKLALACLQRALLLDPQDPTARKLASEVMLRMSQGRTWPLLPSYIDVGGREKEEEEEGRNEQQQQQQEEEEEEQEEEEEEEETTAESWHDLLEEAWKAREILYKEEEAQAQAAAAQLQQARAQETQEAKQKKEETERKMRYDMTHPPTHPPTYSQVFPLSHLPTHQLKGLIKSSYSSTHPPTHPQGSV